MQRQTSMHTSSRIVASCIGLCVLFGVGLFLASSASTEALPEDMRERHEVSITLSDDGFVPQYVRVRRGTRVTFTTTRDANFWPASNTHPAHTMYPEFDPKRPVTASESWSFVFDRVGVWNYHDHIRSYFTGTIYVEE